MDVNKVFNVIVMLCYSFSLFLVFIGIYFHEIQLLYFGLAFVLLGLVACFAWTLSNIWGILIEINSLLKEKRRIV